MQVGDLVYVPYFDEYGVITEAVKYGEYGSPLWRVVYASGGWSEEMIEDLEAVCK